VAQGHSDASFEWNLCLANSSAGRFTATVRNTGTEAGKATCAVEMGYSDMNLNEDEFQTAEIPPRQEVQLTDMFDNFIPPLADTEVGWSMRCE
jgi:hypothetical protein